MTAMMCKKTGCTVPRWVEPRTNIVHDFCGRTHALEALGVIASPHGLCHECNLDGCRKAVAFERETGRVHDFCCRGHAQAAISSGQWPIGNTKPKKVSKVQYCAFRDCFKPCSFDASRDSPFDYCGRSHAIAARMESSSTSQKRKSALVTPTVSIAKSVQHLTTTIPANIFQLPPPPGQSISFSAPPIPLKSLPATHHHLPENLAKISPVVPDVMRDIISKDVLAKEFCVVCSEMDMADSALLPCGHKCVCFAHSQDLLQSTRKQCPLCEMPLTAVVKISNLSIAAAFAASL